MAVIELEENYVKAHGDIFRIRSVGGYKQEGLDIERGGDIPRRSLKSADSDGCNQGKNFYSQSQKSIEELANIFTTRVRL